MSPETSLASDRRIVRVRVHFTFIPAPPRFFFFLWEARLGTLDKKVLDGTVGYVERSGGELHPFAPPSLKN